MLKIHMYYGPNGWRQVPSTLVMGWDKRAWLRLRLACRDADHIAKNAYGEEGPSQADRSYMPEPEEEEFKNRVLMVVPGGRWY